MVTTFNFRAWIRALPSQTLALLCASVCACSTVRQSHTDTAHISVCLTSVSCRYRRIHPLSVSTRRALDQIAWEYWWRTLNSIHRIKPITLIVSTDAHVLISKLAIEWNRENLYYAHHIYYSFKFRRWCLTALTIATLLRLLAAPYQTIWLTCNHRHAACTHHSPTTTMDMT